MKRSQQTKMQTTSTANVPAGSATKSRRGFTLVELLVVISIIGVLVGLLSVAIGPVLTRVHDGAVTAELEQLALSIENFNNQHGFYPPSFSGFDPTIPNPELQLLPFLNKLSPNHREATSGRLAVWYEAIGQHLDDRTSLVFWLAGINSNKQFPITGGLPNVGNNLQIPVAYGGSEVIIVRPDGELESDEVVQAEDGNGNDIAIARESFFDFRGGQFVDEALDLDTPTEDLQGDDEDNRESITFMPGIRAYVTPYGDKRANRGNEYSYRNSAFYTAPGSYHAGPVTDPQFVNPNTFQLFTFGRDGRAANVSLDSNDPDDRENIAFNRDNITNFAGGRLETFDVEANLGL